MNPATRQRFCVVGGFSRCHTPVQEDIDVMRAG